MIRTIRLATGKVRRYALNRFKKPYVDRQMALRQGECNHCGKCCEILFRCPFLLTLEDGSSHCSVYEDRPGQCAAFPIDHRDLADVEFDCTYTFAESLDELVDIEPSSTVPSPQLEPVLVPERLNSTRALPVLLLQRLLNRTP